MAVLKLYLLMKYRDILKMVEKDGWHLVSQEGSHRQYKHPVKRGRVTIAGHPSKEAAAGTLNSCIAAGDDLAETKALMERAIEMHIAGLREDGEPIPTPTTAAEYLEVLVS